MKKLYVCSVFVLGCLFQMDLLASNSSHKRKAEEMGESKSVSDSDSDSDSSRSCFDGCIDLREHEKKIKPVVNHFAQSIDQFGVHGFTTRIIQAEKRVKYNTRVAKYYDDLLKDPTYYESKTKKERIEICELTSAADIANEEFAYYIRSLKENRDHLLSNSLNQDKLALLRTETIDLFDGAYSMNYKFLKKLRKLKTSGLREKAMGA